MTDNSRRPALPISSHPNTDPAVKPQGGIRIGHYILSKTLGTGTFGKVKLAYHQVTGHKVAVKILNRRKIKSLDVVSKIRREIQNLKLVRHPHIIKLYQVISSPTEFYMVMEYVPGGELFEYIVKRGKLQEDEARKIFQQLVSGIDYCHRHNVVHRDLKPENLLLDNNKNVRIADFGLSNMMSDGEFLRTSCGSPNYAAPEVISGKLYAGPEIDVWSCGVILYALVCGVLPFDDEYVPNLFKKIRAGVYHKPEHVSEDCRFLIKRMLEVDQVKRITIHEIKQNKWFKMELPSYLFPDELLAQRREIIDMETVYEVAQKFGIDHKKILGIIQEQQAKLKVEVTGGSASTNASSSTLGPDDSSGSRALVGADNWGMNNNPLYAAYCMLLDSKVLYEHAPDFYHAEKKVDEDFKNPANVRLLAKTDNMIHPERIMRVLDHGPSDQNPPPSGTKSMPSRPGNKALKWHLGIRSQSPPHDIMFEVYKAMKKLDFHWKLITPYYLIVRRKIPNTTKFAFMTLQLYQIDYKSFLLDFANKIPANKKPAAIKEIQTLTSEQVEDMVGKQTEDEIKEKQKKQGLVITKDGQAKYPAQHVMMEFFEMCAILIKCLAGEN